MNSIARTALATALLAISLAAQFPQDLIAINFAGDAFTVDSRTGVGQALGPTGRPGHNCMARLGRQIYTVEQVGTGATAQRFLNTIDDETGQAFRSVPITRDLRGLAAGGTELMAIADNGTNDELVRVSVLNGPITVIGSTGFASVQGLTLHNGTFYGWDLNAGLIRINFQTGAATDVNPNVGTNGAAIQFLTTMSDGRVLGGNSAVYEIDVTTGIPTLHGSGAYNDLRGAEERFGVAYTFGQGCGNVSLSLTGTPRPGFTITTASTGNRRATAGFMLLGFSDRNYVGLPLPVRLDGLLGTIDCFLYTSNDFTVGTTANAFGVMSVPVPIPPFTNGLIFHVQHVSLSNSPGGLAFSDAGTVRVSL